jgi:hypothetical protein
MIHPYNESTLTIIENMNSNDNSNDNSSSNEITYYVNKIDNGRQSIRKIKKNLVQIVGEEEDAKLRMTENFYDYWIWTILMFVILWLLYICYTNKEHSTMTTLYILIFLTLMYIFHSYILSV